MGMTDWPSIDTAPRDGTVILSDVGTVAYVDRKNWSSPVTEGWWLCAVNCQPEMSDDSCPDEPTRWNPHAFD